MTVKLQKVGNSYMITIPKMYVEELQLQLGESLSIRAEGHTVIISRAENNENKKYKGGNLKIKNFDLQKAIQEIKNRDYETE